MNEVFSDVKGKLGFGCMRLARNEDGTVNKELFSQLVDKFIENGFNYFDTAHPYLDEQSENAVKDCLTSRYDREKFVLADKMSYHYFNSKEEAISLFNNQLEWCGVDYFDYYLLHCISKDNYEHHKRCDTFNVIQDFKNQGKIKHIGISFHDEHIFLDQLLTEHPEIEFVQIQFNYADLESKIIQSKENYEVCVKHGKPCIVMEPVKGGTLANLPKDAANVFKELGDSSNASYALRFAASYDNNKLVLSGMKDMEMLLDNISSFKDLKKLNDNELDAIKKVIDILLSKNLVACTNCRYCVDGCPQKILIPDIFNCYNLENQFSNHSSKYYYKHLYTYKNGKANSCIKCGKCEKTCPQHLNIRELLVECSKIFDE